MSEYEIDYPCVGVCMADPDSGYCLGCGRPPLAESPLGDGVADGVLRPSLALPAGELAECTVPVDAELREA